MLNKNQSKKWNSLKYALVLPVLVAFVFFFQMEVIAKEKNQDLKAMEKSVLADAEIYKIDKNTSEADLKEKAETIKQSHGLTVHFSKTKRNSNNELTAISIEIKGKEITENRTIKSSEGIKPFAILISKDSDNKLSIDFVEDQNTGDKITINTATAPKVRISEDTEIYIDEERSDKAEMDKLDPKDIVTVNVFKKQDRQEVRVITRKHADMDSHEEHFINGQKLNNDAPVPPTPPTPPVMKEVTPPAMPQAPKAPKGDPISGDKKAWKKFEKQMEEFELKMKEIEPQMEAFDKQMAEFDKQMEPFDKEMKAFDEKMKVYEKEVQKFLADKKKAKS